MNYSQVERDNIARGNRLAIDCDPLYLSFPIFFTSICYNLRPVSWRVRKKKKKRKYTFEKRTALVW